MKLINPLVIIRILSTILFLESVLFLFCLPVTHIYNESPYPFLWSSLITTTISVIFYLISKEVQFDKINIREGYLSVSLSWLLFTGFGTLPYILSGTIPSFVDAFFESSSGFTTTGSSIVSDVEILPYSILFWRSFTHWIGGLGIIVLVIIILPSLRITRFQFFGLESSLKEKIHPKTKAVGFRLLYIYMALTLIEMILLWAGEMNLFDSICQTFGTVATGGFSTRNTSISGFSAYSQYIIGLFMLLSGVSFVIYYHLVKMQFRKIKRNEELWFYLASIFLAGIIATSVLLVKTSKPLEPAFREGFFQVISVITCTGYSSSDYLYWPLAGTLLMFILMFAGGSTGSTSGGIKMARHLMVIKNIKSALVKLVHPNVISQLKLNGKVISDKTNITIISFVILYLFIFLIGTILVVITGVDPVSSASGVAASMANFGPGLGTIGPMSNYGHMPETAKMILSLMMIIGRLEIFTVFILFAKSFWRL